MPQAPHILLIQPKRIGDLILTAPAVNGLRRTFPEAQITLAATGASCAISPLLGADEILSYRHRRPNLPFWSRIATAKYQIAIDFGGTDRSALFARASRAPIRATFEKAVAGRRRARAFTHLSKASVRDLHTVDLHLALVDEAVSALHLANGQKDTPPSSVPASNNDTSLHLPGTLIASVRDLIKLHTGDPETPYAIVHPGTARPEKYWLPDRWAAVILHLSNRGLTPVITGSNDPSERSHLDRIHEILGEKRLPAPVVDLAGQISLPQLAALIAASQVAVGVDTAAMHLAAAFARPQVVLFGPTNPYHWRPRHPKASVLIASSPETPTTDFTPRHKKAPMSQISTGAVTRAIDAFLPVPIEKSGNPDAAAQT